MFGLNRRGVSQLIVPLSVFGALAVARAAPIGVELMEVMAGANGDAAVQFLVVRQVSDGQNGWGPRPGEVHARAQLAFFDATGRETGRFTFPADPPTGGTQHILIATSSFAALPGAPAPDVVIPPLLNPHSGMVCFRANPLHPVDTVEECLAPRRFAPSIFRNSVAGSTSSLSLIHI